MPQRGLCPNSDLPCASRAAELPYAVGDNGRTGVRVPQIAAAGTERVRSRDPWYRPRRTRRRGDAPRWNIGPGRPILSRMDDTPHHRDPADREPPMPSEAELLASLARSEAELAAGQIVSGEEVLRELDESIARMEAKREGRTPHRTAIRR